MNKEENDELRAHELNDEFEEKKLKEFKTLSDKRQDHGNGITKYYCEPDVKEFIKRIKETVLGLSDHNQDHDILFINDEIDKLAGEKLC